MSLKDADSHFAHSLEDDRDMPDVYFSHDSNENESDESSNGEALFARNLKNYAGIYIIIVGIITRLHDA